MDKNYISTEDYAKIHALMPIFCVDLVIERDGKYLVLRREVEPDKGKYWVPGGRLRKGESILEAAARFAKEVQLSVEVVKFLDYLDYQSPADPFGHGKGTHTVSLVFLCRVVGGDVVLDKNHSRAEWWDGSRYNRPDMPSAVESLIFRAMEVMRG